MFIKIVLFTFQSSHNPHLAAGTKLELPFWMVWALRGRGRVEPYLPKNWNATQRTIISADADVVDLVGLFLLILFHFSTFLCHDHFVNKFP
jgi:hypothetical protein